MSLWPENARAYIRAGRAYFRRIDGEFTLIVRVADHQRCRIVRETNRGSVIVRLPSGEEVLADKASVQVMG